MEPVRVARSVTQVTDGSVYKGDVTINGTRFEYELTIRVPIQNWTTEPDLPTLAAACDFYRIQVKKESMLLDLEVLEQFLFVRLLAGLVLDLYHSPQTRNLNASGASVLLSGIGGSMSIALSSPETDFNFSPEYREMLFSPKFGCTQALA